MTPNDHTSGNLRPMLPDGRIGEALGEPFRVWEHPPGVVWQAVIINHRLFPVDASTLRPAPARPAPPPNVRL